MKLGSEKMEFTCWYCNKDFDREPVYLGTLTFCRNKHREQYRKFEDEQDKIKSSK